MKNLFVFIPLALAVAGCAPTTDRAEADASASRSKVPEATSSGPAVDCVQIHSIRESRVHNDRVIDFHMNNGQIYRNTLPHACPQLGFEKAFSYKTSLSKLCNVDMISVLVRGGPVMQGATCGLGQFQPVRLDKKHKQSQP